MLLNDRREEWDRRMRRYQQAQKQSDQTVRPDSPLITVDFWNVPDGYTRTRTLDAAGWDALLQDQLKFRRRLEVLGGCVRDSCRLVAELEGRPFGRLPQTLRRSQS